MNDIRLFVREIIAEKRVWKDLTPEDQKSFLSKQEMSPLNVSMFRKTFEKAKSNGIYLQFSDAESLVVKPMATHNYRGIYGWNIANFSFEEFVKVVPSMWANRKFIILFKPKDANKLLVASKYSKEELKADLDSLLGMLDGEQYDFLHDNMDTFLSSEPYYGLVDAIEATFTETGRSIQNYKTGSAVPVKGLNYATKYMIELGYEGVLLTEEIVMFKTQFVDTVSTFNNPLRKQSK